MAYFRVSTRCSRRCWTARPGLSDLNLSVGRARSQVELDGQLRPVAYAGIERLLPYQTELIAMRLLAEQARPRGQARAARARWTSPTAWPAAPASA